MRPYTLMEDSPESLEDNEIGRRRLHKAGENGCVRKSFDIMSAFLDVLGKPASEVPEHYERGETLIDTAMDLETNSSKGFVAENTIFLERGPIQEDAIVKIAQTAATTIVTMRECQLVNHARKMLISCFYGA